MKRDYVETFLNKKVQITLKSGEVINGIFRKSQDKRYAYDPSIFLLKNYYFCDYPMSFLFRSSHIKKILECN